MSDSTDHSSTPGRSSPLRRAVVLVGDEADRRLRDLAGLVRNIGGMAYLLADTLAWLARSVVTRRARLRVGAIVTQSVRVGVNSIPIIVLVQAFIGCILALQLAPTLDAYGQLDQVATVIAVAMTRELGPMLSAVVLSGFAGASIAAEISAMVEGEEIKALRAHALDPVQFLVVPRFVATVVMITGLTVIADVVGITGGLLTSWGVLDLDPSKYLEMTRAATDASDVLTGLAKAAVFGVIIAMIACHEGLSVRGGAVGVGRATTSTVVKCIVVIIGVDAVFTAVFFALGV